MINGSSETLLNERARPDYLYRYSPCNSNSLQNLRNSCVWYSLPKDFNDPLDCNISFDLQNISHTDYLCLYKLCAEEAKKKGAGWVSEDFFVKIFEASFRTVLTSYLQMTYETLGVICFTQSFPDNLMWSHYADNHKGFCLQFKSSHPPFSSTFRIKYGDLYPQLDPVRLLCKKDGEEIKNAVRYKSRCWSYEQEWRLIDLEGNHPENYADDALEAVYLGRRMSPCMKILIASLLQDKPSIKLFEMKLDSQTFGKLTPVSYIPSETLLSIEEANSFLDELKRLAAK